MKIADFRIQTTAPDAPGAGVIGVYANPSGVLLSQDSAGNIVRVGSSVLNTYKNANVSTGGSATLLTGAVFAASNSTGPVTGLANPSIWLNFSVSGVQYAVPAYTTR